MFKTKTGFGHILSDKIILSKNGQADNLDVPRKRNPKQNLIIYITLTLFALYTGYESFQKGDVVEPLFMIILASLMLFSIFTNLKTSTDPTIDRNAIEKVVFKKASSLLSTAMFEVHFKDEKGKVKRRLIVLPGTKQNGKEETEKALALMKKEGLIES